MRVLGVDPGLTRCGVGVIESGRAREIACLGVGVVRTPSTDELADRLMAVAEGVEGWMDAHRPEVVAVERVFSQQNVRTVMGTAQVSGIVALAAARRDLPVAFHTPSAVKAAISGSGRADKRQVTTMITKILGLESPPKPADAADALALAVCHLWRAPMSDRIAEAEAKAAQLARNHRARLADAARERGSTGGQQR
ncbi:crossover junction endodeoxyribonuclease RuvC [Saccharopolyspora lacisalsi]|uniref:Crossover junction endodeoxyribonuclease RuvC n=1 Tax=Halosaccharopolyspora lacisalsi TaxID=1000566 RepID=A0A839DXM2_9PSEU|nr:crossover junction endodeoxyribonuclease RuvC [Halosaccharopolyspora lacisalsi]MBA8823488.1 crossover junction endodeoxyribonuclease RuvC [Halosaccharopolyspora lacisalsi]